MDRLSFWTPEPGSWRESLFALAPFLLAGVLPAMNLLHPSPYIPTAVTSSLRLGFLGVSLCLCVMGLVKGLPRWAWSYLGMLLSAGSLYALGGRVLSGLYPLLVRRSDPWFWRQVVYQGWCWGGLSIAAAVIVALAAVLPLLRGLYVCLLRDWTPPSFGPYSSALLARFVTLDDHVHEEPYRLTAMMILVAAGWGYLRLSRIRQRALVLPVALTLAMGVAATGKTILYTRPDWPYPRFGRFTPRPRTEALSTVIMRAWLMTVILAPVLLSFLPDRDRRAGPETV
jgi:hypothetical protein